MDAGVWISATGVAVALLAAVANAIFTYRSRKAARSDAVAARTIAEGAVAETKRIADAAEERVRLLKAQLDEERERAKPQVKVAVLDAFVSGQGIGSADMRIRFTVHNVSRWPDVLTDVTVGFGDQNYYLPPKSPSVNCYGTDGKQPVRIPMQLESNKPVELTLTFSPAMGGRVQAGWESPAAVERLSRSS